MHPETAAYMSSDVTCNTESLEIPIPVSASQNGPTRYQLTDLVGGWAPVGLARREGTTNIDFYL